MGKIIAGEYITLDGVMEAPENWQFPYYSDDYAAWNTTQVLEADALLLGRVTYEIFASHWPLQTHNEFGVADKLNAMPKFVVAPSLEKAEWNNSTLIRTNVNEEIARLKQNFSGNIGIAGSATLVRSLVQAGLIDQLNLSLHPIVLGSGKRLFTEGHTALKLADSKVFSSGVVVLTYHPA